MTPDDLASFATLSDPQIHPDGDRIVFVVSRMNLDDDRYDRSIWIWDGDAARPFTHGPVDARPRWSPDGARLALLRASGKKGEAAQLAVMDSSGGEAEVLTSFDLGVSEAEWSPDGARLALVATEWANEWRDLDDEKREKQPRRITAPEWRFDNEGYLHDRRTHIHRLDLAGGQPVALTDGDRPDHGIVWRPDGGAIGFLSGRHERAAFVGENQAWEVSVDGGEPSALVPPGSWDNLSYRPDGVAHVAGLERVADYPASAQFFRLDGDRLVRLCADYDRSIVSCFPAPSPLGPQWLEDGTCRAVGEERGRMMIVEVAPDGSWREIAGGLRFITGMTTTGDGRTMALISSSPTDPGELAVVEDGEERVVTRINAGFRTSGSLIEPEHILIESDGVELDVWVYLPPGDEKVPVLLNIHGGPAAQYGWIFFDEFQVYAGAGYGVVATNPRGGSGRGTEFVRGVVGHWHEERPPDVEDLLAALDGAIDRFDRLDADRVGIMGGSYGGLISVKVLAVDHRFKSAVPERGLYNFASFAGTSDIGLYFGDLYVGDRDYDDWSALWEASPLRTAHRITTPCLVIHSDSDFRCPIEQGEQLFTTLIDNGIEAELLRYPGESHELSRSGTPSQRRHRYDAILDWHGRYLGAPD
jgi:dipeptidyl aminopeptidase/acylaminoacyl peptidase